jgi:hypothetical protein
MAEEPSGDRSQGGPEDRLELVREEFGKVRAALARRAIALARVEELAEAARREVEAAIAAKDATLDELRQLLARERGRANRLEALLDEARKPWWRRRWR